MMKWIRTSRPSNPLLTPELWLAVAAGPVVQGITKVSLSGPRNKEKESLFVPKHTESRALFLVRLLAPELCLAIAARPFAAQTRECTHIVSNAHVM